MCGINGIVDLEGTLGPERLAALCTQMRDAQPHRGPDDAGIWLSPCGRVALGHRRLSIIDLSPEGRQPMGNEDGSVQVTFNGEIYGFKALRASLEAQGHRFRTRTDTEVLPHLFESMEEGTLESRLNALDGMFAFAVWNPAAGKLLLARDPFGKKPLYVMEGRGYVAFASELQCFRGLPGFRPEVDPAALAEYLLLQYVSAPRSIWTQVRKLEPGSYALLDVDRRRLHPSRPYWSFQATGPARRPAGRTEAEEVETLRTLLLAAVEKRLMSDVPLGGFLSGGVDSSLTMAMVTRELGRPVETFSIGFGGTEESEHLFARQTAELLGTTHRDEVLEPDAVALVQEISRELDEPNGDSSCLPTWLLCRFARRHVTVAISGDGGDELFGGYGRYRDTIMDMGGAGGSLGDRVRAALRRLAAPLRGRSLATPADAYLSPRWLIWMPEDVARLVGGLPPAVAEELATWRRQLNDPRTPLLHRMRTLDANTYMPGAVLAKVDRMSMRHSLEVRSPLLDREVAAFAMGISEESCWRPPAETKRILKRLASRYLPDEWMQRRKMGFGLPANAWSRPQLLAMAKDLLLSQDGRTAGLVDRTALQETLARQEDPSCFSIYRLWPLLVLELWLRNAGQGDAARTLPAGGAAGASPSLAAEVRAQS